MEESERAWLKAGRGRPPYLPSPSRAQQSRGKATKGKREQAMSSAPVCLGVTAEPLAQLVRIGVFTCPQIVY